MSSYMTFGKNHYSLRRCARRGTSDFNPRWKSAAIPQGVESHGDILAGFTRQILHKKSLSLETGIHLDERSFLHTTKDSVVVLVTSSTASLIIIFVIIILLHLNITIKLTLVSGIAFGLARMLAWSES